MKGIVTWGVPRIPNHQSKPSGEFFHLEVVFCRRRDRCLYCAFADFLQNLQLVIYFDVFFFVGPLSVIESSPQFGSFFTSGSEFCELQVAQVLEGSSAIMMYNDYIMIIYELFEVHWL